MDKGLALMLIVVFAVTFGSILFPVIGISFVFACIGVLQGLAFSLSVGLKYGWESKRLKVLFIVIPLISGMAILHEWLSYTISPVIEIEGISEVLNGIGVWGTIGIALGLTTLSFDALYDVNDEDAKMIGYLSLFLALTGLAMTVISGVMQTPLKIQNMLPLIVFNNCSFFTFLVVAVGSVLFFD